MSKGGRRAGFGRTHAWRRIAATLGVLALLSQTLVILVHRPPSALPVDHAAMGHAAMGHATMAMAMTMGPDCPMLAGDAPAPAPDKPARKAPPVCPICQSLQLSGSFLLPAQVAVPAPQPVVVALEAPRKPLEPAVLINERARSRAPPAVLDSLTATVDG